MRASNSTDNSTDRRRQSREREADLAARWAAGEWRGQTLCTQAGAEYNLLFQGRPGGGAGPDFRDAVLARADGSRVRGDVELHLRASNWQTHGHASDPRYNAVVLHIVLTSTVVSSPLANGTLVPVVVLRTPSDPAPPRSDWPCAKLAERLGTAALRDMLRAAGHERFAARVSSFTQELAIAEIDGARDRRTGWTAGDRVLFVALAEGLGYGRDRAALRGAGERLARGDPPEELLAEADGRDGRHGWPQVEKQRLRGLLALRERWREHGPWEHLRQTFSAESPQAAGRALLRRLVVEGGCVSPGRAKILAANVVLPFAAAVASTTGDPALGPQAVAVYVALPGLPSNQITREMLRQFGMSRLPPGAAVQQGLHHVWNMWCRDKRCAACPCAAV